MKNRDEFFDLILKSISVRMNNNYDIEKWITAENQDKIIEALEKQEAKQLLVKENLFELSLFAEWIKTHAKHCEPDGWKDQDGLGATMSSTDLAERFKKSTAY